MKTLRASKLLFDAWNERNIIYCHWKSNEHLIEGLQGYTDLDILVDPVHKDMAEEGLEKCGYKKYRPQYGSRYPGVDEWIGFDEETGRLIHIHRYDRILTGHKGMKEYNLPWADAALKTRVQDKATGVYMMEPNLELMTLYTRIGLKASVRRVKQAKNNSFKLGEEDQAEIRYLKERAERTKLDGIVRKYYGDKGETLLNIIDSPEIDSAAFLRLVHVTTAASFRPRGSAWSAIQKYYYAIALRAISFCKNRLRKNIITRKVPDSGKGLMAAFVGQDGAGKSTVTDDIETWLTWKIEAKKFYLGSGEHHHSWRKGLHDKLPKRKNIVTAPIGAWLTLSDCAALAKSSMKTIRKAKAYARKGGVAIFDRYPQVVYPGTSDGPKIRTNYVPKIHNPLVKAYALSWAVREEKYLKRAVEIIPDVVFKLMLPPEESIKRKPEENLDMVTRKHEIISNLDFAGAETYVVDATEEYTDEIRRMKALLWDRMQK